MPAFGSAWRLAKGHPNSPIMNTVVMLSLCAGLPAPWSAMAQGVSFDDAAFVAATKTVESAPGRLSEEPMLRADVIKLVGYAYGDYTTGGTLIARQLLDSLRSQFDIMREGVAS